MSSLLADPAKPRTATGDIWLGVLVLCFVIGHDPRKSWSSGRGGARGVFRYGHAKAEPSCSSSWARFSRRRQAEGAWTAFRVDEWRVAESLGFSGTKVVVGLFPVKCVSHR